MIMLKRPRWYPRLFKIHTRENRYNNNTYIKQLSDKLFSLISKSLVRDARCFG